MGSTAFLLLLGLLLLSAELGVTEKPGFCQRYLPKKGCLKDADCYGQRKCCPNSWGVMSCVIPGYHLTYHISTFNQQNNVRTQEEGGQKKEEIMPENIDLEPQGMFR
ncbi:waprin-Phi2-like isoform X2 [Sphaerodactylus townsendi]|uniref:waprin-Phi2-like isoform X2 n=1 Tax=Sphaerodactylus townsendi TaxID=933632 RepID=UPI002026F0E5|nr:waprin-Phi2-like isoform X2 [Sphaerodactylus townsendi]